MFQPTRSSIILELTSLPSLGHNVKVQEQRERLNCWAKILFAFVMLNFMQGSVFFSQSRLERKTVVWIRFTCVTRTSLESCDDSAEAQGSFAAASPAKAIFL